MKAVAVMQDVRHYLPVLVEGPKDLMEKGAMRWLAERHVAYRDAWDYLKVEKVLFDLEENTREEAEKHAVEYAEEHALPYLRL